MTGVVTRDSAQRRPSDKHRSDARNFLQNPPPLVPTSPAGAPCPILQVHRPIRDSAPPRRRLRRLHENRPIEVRSGPDPHRHRAPQCPRFRKRGPSIERGHCGGRHITPDRPPGPPGRRRRRRVTFQGRSGAEEARQRLDAVTAVAFPSCHGALAADPALTSVGHWPT